MCSAESPGPQVVHGKLAANLAAAANWPHLSSPGWLFLPCSFPSVSPGSITAWGGGRASSDKLLAPHTALGLWPWLGSAPHPGLPPLPELPCNQNSQILAHLGWFIGEKISFFPPPPNMFLLLLFELTEMVG